MNISRYKSRYKIFTRLKENIWGTSKFFMFNNLKWRFSKKFFRLKQNNKFYRFKKKSLNKKRRVFYGFNFSKNRLGRVYSLFLNDLNFVKLNINNTIVLAPLGKKQLVNSINKIKNNSKTKKIAYAVE